jgi:hypothetical protein
MSATRPPAFDDRFSAPIEASRRGAHRARPKPASAGLPIVAGIAVVLLVLGASYVMFKDGGTGDSNSNLAAASAVDGEPDTTASAGPKSAQPSAGTTTDAGTAPTKGAGAGTKVNRDIRFKLLNSTSISGLAKRVRTDLQGKGWTIAEDDMGNSLNRSLVTTKIYYGRAGTKATAQALQKDLGFGKLFKDASALTASDLTTSDLAVVLGTDAG